VVSRIPFGKGAEDRTTLPSAVPTGLKAAVLSLRDKKMLIITSRGGDYATTMRGADFQEPYLRSVFAFVGITDITFIHAQPIDMGGPIQEQKIIEARQEAEKVANRW
jgi:FMN-dependent NADH-azoreductase